MSIITMLVLPWGDIVAMLVFPSLGMILLILGGGTELKQ